MQPHLLPPLPLLLPSLGTPSLLLSRLLIHNTSLREPFRLLFPLPPLRPIITPIAHRQPPLRVHLLVRVEFLGHTRFAYALRFAGYCFGCCTLLPLDGSWLREGGYACGLKSGGIDVGDKTARLGEVLFEVCRDVGRVGHGVCGDETGDGGAVVVVLVVEALEDITGGGDVLLVVCVQECCTRSDQ